MLLLMVPHVFFLTAYIVLAHKSADITFTTHRGSEERGVLGVWSIPDAILPSC